MQSISFKKLLPHLLIILGFAVFSLVYCYPALQGKSLTQHDLMNWEAMFHQSRTYYDSTGINPLWTNSMFGGMPAYTIGYPVNKNYVSEITYTFIEVMAKPAYHFFLAMACFYVLMIVMRINRWLSVIGAFAYAFSTYNVVIIAVGHETKMLSIAYFPAVLAGVILLYRGRLAIGTILLSLSLTLMIGVGHWQVLYYAFFVFGGYVICKLIETIRNKTPIKKFLIPSAIGLVIVGIGAATCMSTLLPTREYTKFTMRGGESELTINKDPNKKAGGLDKDYAFSWSNGVMETFCAMIPYLYGGSMSEPIDKAPETEALVGGQLQSAPLYWGPQKMGISGPVYFGAIICFLFVLGCIIVKSPHKWWIIAVCALTIMMSWGDNFKALNYFLFDNLPMYNKFRVPSMILLVPEMLFPILAIWGLMDIASGKIAGEELIKKLKIAAGITAGICLLFAFGGSMFFDYSNATIDAQFPKQLIEPLKQDRQALATKSSLISASFILLSAALIWGYAKDKLNKNLLIGGIGLLIFIDLISVAKNYLNENNYEDTLSLEEVFAPRPVDMEVLKDTDPYYRVLDLSRNVYNDAFAAYHFKNVGGYSPAKMEHYQDLIDVQMGGAQSQGKFNAEVLNMLNTKYIIFQAGQQGQVAYQPNPNANGNAWFVQEVKTVKTADEEMMAMNAAALGDTAVVPNAFDSKNTAVMREEFAKSLSGYSFGKDSAATIKLTKYGMNDLSFVSNNTQDGVAVFSDIWYPLGWEATIDGKPAEIMRANYVLRALKIPAGQHTIEFHFRPHSYALGAKLAVSGNIALFALIAIAGFFFMKGKKTEETMKEEDGVM